MLVRVVNAATFFIIAIQLRCRFLLNTEQAL